MMRPKAGSITPNAAFLNIPYDQRFRSLYLAYIAGLVHLGFVPRVTLGLTGGARRLDKIIAEIQGCRYSIHDISRVGLDRNPPFAAQTVNRLDEGFRKEYTARCHHKPKGVAKVAAAGKLAVRLYWMLRQNVGYPEIALIESSPRVPLVGKCQTEGLIGRSRLQR